MAAFPTPTSGSILKYPLTRSSSFGTGVFQFINGGEQRVPDRGNFNTFVLVGTGVNGYDMSLVLKFIHSTKGGYDNTWTLTLPVIGGSPITYIGCYFVDDKHDVPHVPAERNNFTLRIAQTP